MWYGHSKELDLKMQVFSYFKSHFLVFLLFLVGSLGQRYANFSQGEMLRELLYYSSDTKLTKINTNLQVKICMNFNRDTASRDRTDNRVIEITYLNKSIFQERRRWTELCRSYGWIKTVWFNQAMNQAKVQFSLNSVSLPFKILHFSLKPKTIMHCVYITIKLGTARLSERMPNRMESSLPAFTQFSSLTLCQIHSCWISFCFNLNKKAQ